MKVYVLEVGCYSDRWVVGVYSSKEKAQAAWLPKATGEKDAFGEPFTYTWDGDDFDADWSDAAHIYEHELDAVASDEPEMTEV